MFSSPIPSLSTSSCCTGRRAFAQSLLTRSSVSSPDSVVKSMHVIARSSQAICQSFFTVRRVASVAARRSTALVFIRNCSTQSRFSEVPRFAHNPFPANVAIVPTLLAATPGINAFPFRSTNSSFAGLSCDMLIPAATIHTQRTKRIAPQPTLREAGPRRILSTRQSETLLSFFP